jgi:hypothetical protein
MGAIACCVVRCDAEDRNLGRDLLELLHGGVAIDGNVSASSGCAGEVTAQDRRSSSRIDILEAHSFSAAMTQDGATIGRSHVEDPVRVLAEHRHEIALTIVLGYDHRKRDDAARAPSRHRKRRETVWPDPS